MYLGSDQLSRTPHFRGNWPKVAETGRKWPKLAESGQKSGIWPGRGVQIWPGGVQNPVQGGSKSGPGKVVHLRGKLPKISQISGPAGAGPGSGQNLTTIGTRA